MRQHANDGVYMQTRSFAAVIFRRIASKSRKLPNGDNVETFLSLQQEQAYAIRQKLLEALGSESTNGVRNKIGDAVAEIAREYSDGSASTKIDLHSTSSLRLQADSEAEEQWPEILGVLFTLSISKEVGQREIAYRIFSTTPGIIEKQHEDTVLSAFTKGFKDDDVTVCFPHLCENRPRR